MEKEAGKYWNLCSTSVTDKNRWICAIKKSKGIKCDLPTTEIINQKIKKERIEQPIIIIPIPSPMCNEKWNYNAHGNEWQCKCKEGTNQSPIDLPVSKEAVKINNGALFEFMSINTDQGGNLLSIRLEDYKLIIHVTFLVIYRGTSAS